MDIRGYEANIAPPTETGDVADTGSLEFALRRTEAIRGLGAAKQQLGQSITGAAETFGTIFGRLDSLRQQAELNKALDQFDVESQGVLLGLDKNRESLAPWGSDDAGAPSELITNWQTARLEALGQNLSGKYRDEFEHQVRQRTLRMGLTIDEMSMKYSYDSIRTSDQNRMSALVNSPDTSNITGSINNALEEANSRLQAGVVSGIYSHQEAASEMARFQKAIVDSHYLAVSADIQDPDGWRDPASGTFYRGYNGALDMVEDKVASGDLSEGQGSDLTKLIDEQYTLKGTRGAAVQRTLSVEYYNEFAERIARGDFPTTSEIWDDPRIHYEETRNYRRDGDRTIAQLIQNLKDGALDDRRSGDDFIVAPEVWKRMNDPTWDDASFREWLIKNGEKWHTQDQIQNILNRSRDVYTAAKSGEVRSMVEDVYRPLLANARNDEDRANLLAQQDEDIQALLRGIRDDDVLSEIDVAQVRSNYLRGKLEAEIFKDYAREDRRLNPAESMLLVAQQGGLRGVMGIPRFRQEATAMGELHRQMITEIYGEDNILDIRWGDAGTYNEGRVVFRILDQIDRNPDGTPKEKWVRYRLNVQDTDETGAATRGEEVLEEFNPAEYNAEQGEVWNDAAAPVLIALDADRREAAGQEGFQAVEDSGILPETAATILGSGTDLQAVGNLATGVPAIRPGANDAVGIGMSWYRGESNGSKISLNKVNEQINSMIMSPETEAQFRDAIYAAAKEDLIQSIRDQQNSGAISLFRQGGELRMTARRAVARIASDFGVSDDYVDAIIRDAFGDRR